MNLVRAFKSPLYPTAKQKALLHELFGMSRFVFNCTLGKIKNSDFGTYEVKNGKNKGTIVPQIPSQTEIVGLSTKLKSDFEFLSKMPNDYIQSSLSNLYLGTKNFYRGSGYPKFKSRKNSRQSFDMKAGSRVKLLDNYIQLNRSNESSYSRDDHKIQFNKHFSVPDNSTITGFSISKDTLGYYLTVTYKFEIQDKPFELKNPIGIDLGLKDTAICSDGFTYPRMKFTNQYAQKLKRAQQLLSRKQKGSKNRTKAKIKVAKVHRKITNSRNHYLHTISRDLTNKSTFISLETLHVKNMVQNRRLSKAISDVAWSTLVQMISYKQTENQGLVHKIDTFYPSSKICSRCNHKLTSLSLSQRTYICPSCGLEIDRDLNASINILNKGLLDAGYNSEEIELLRNNQELSKIKSMELMSA